MRAGASGAVFVVAILAPALAWAQDGAIVGRVLDPAGDPLPGTTIEVVGPALAGPRVAVADLQGRYRVTELPLGMYTVTLSLPGFRSVVRDGIVVVTGLAPRVDAELDVGTDDYDRVDVRIDFPGPGGSGGGAALECTFLPVGAIVDCRRVDVAGQQLRRFR